MDASPADLPEHVIENRRYWDGMAGDWVERGARNWASEPSWGEFDIPESQVGMLPADMSGVDAIELGCGTAYVSGWMARRGARVVGIDNSEAQLATARRFAGEHGAALTLMHGNAEAVPYPDASFDFAISEYGAAIWCDPYAWIPEAHRLLRPGGRLIFLANSVLSMLCAPPDDTPLQTALVRDQFGMHRLEWEDSDGVSFCLPHGETLRLLRDTGFEVEALHELQAPEGDEEVQFFVPRGWARRWPCEEVWVARKR